MKKDDTLWKGLLEDLFEDFLLFIFKEQAEILDLGKGYEFLNNELAQIFPVDADAEHPKHVDKLVKVFTRQGLEEWILVHVEIQGYEDKKFAERMFTYFYRILDKYGKKITCIAVFTGNNAKPGSNAYEYKFLGTENNFKFNTYNIAVQNREELTQNDNVFALVVLAVLNVLEKARLAEGELLRMQIAISKALLQKNIPKNKVRALVYFLRYYVYFDNPENVSKFDKEISFLNNAGNMGIEELLKERFKKEGLQIGRQEGKQEAMEESKAFFVKSLLLNTDFDTTKIASLAGVNEAFVENIKLGLGK